MLRFRLFGFPVEVHWMFWVVSGLLGGSAATGAENPGVVILLWVAVVFVSVLWHEIGHAVFMRKYGGMARIHLYGMGGLAIPVAGRPTRQESITISLMGPIFGLLLGGATWLFARHVAPEGYYVQLTIGYLLWVNIVWSIVNLLPVLPLDGGRVTEALLANKVGGLQLTAKIGMVVAGAVMLYAMYLGLFFAAMLFGYFAYQNYHLVKGVPRGF